MATEPTAAQIAWQLARMEDGATEADARELLILVETEALAEAYEQ